MLACQCYNSRVKPNAAHFAWNCPDAGSVGPSLGFQNGANLRRAIFV